MQTRIEALDGWTWEQRVDRDAGPPAARPRRPVDEHRCRAAPASAWRWRRHWWPRPTCCCWTSPPTTWTWTPSTGWRNCSRPSAARAADHPRPRLPGRRGHPHRRAGPRPAAQLPRQLQPPSRRPSQRELEAEALATTPAPTSCWRRRRCGCARAWRRGAPAASARITRLEVLREKRAARRDVLGRVLAGCGRRRRAAARSSRSWRTCQQGLR